MHEQTVSRLEYEQTSKLTKINMTNKMKQMKNWMEASALEMVYIR